MANSPSTAQTADQQQDEIAAVVREKYGEAARRVMEAGAAASCCGPAGSSASGPVNSCCGGAAFNGSTDPITSNLYVNGETDELPSAAVLASLGCGNPTAVAELREGERVLDLGSGGGIDVLLSAKRVGATGRAFGLDMTDEMLALAQRNAAEAGATNVEFLKGHIESIPLPAESIDVVISNCVVNLAADKSAVFREIARVLRPGGRIGITDIVAEDSLTPDQRAERGTYVGCIAGALSFAEFESGLLTAGLTDVWLTRSHEVADGMHSVIAKASKPMGAEPHVSDERRELPMAAGCGCGAGGCC